MDIQNPERTLKVCTNFNEVTLKKEYKTKVLQVLFGIKRELAEELEKLGVTEDYNND